MYLINASLKNIKTITLLLICFISFNAFANDVPDFLKNQKGYAEEGHVWAQYNLGVMYNNGKGVIQDHKQAVKWYRKAAEQGYATAQFNLALMYDNGKGVIQDHKQAFKWYRKAAEQGYADAQYNLAHMYDNGQGVIQSSNNSYIWNTIAAANGHENAIYNRDLVAKNLSPRGLEEAQKEAAKLYEKINNK